MVVIIQFAIASGATVGVLVFELSGYRATFELRATLLACRPFLPSWLRAQHCGTLLHR
jgi:predicted MFS family arabinose efflux permease